MKTLYQCEICQRLYQTPAAAQLCEVKGIPEDIQPGVLFTPAGKTHMVFAVVHNVRVEHMRWTYCYAASDLENGETHDSFSDNVLSLISPEATSFAPNQNWPCTQRMLSALRSKRMTARFFKAEDYARL